MMASDAVESNEYREPHSVEQATWYKDRLRNSCVPNPKRVYQLFLNTVEETTHDPTKPEVNKSLKIKYCNNIIKRPS